MKATELIKPEEKTNLSEYRIGNYILDCEAEPEVGIYWKIEQIANYGKQLGVFYRNGSCWSREPEPIELTEELLLRAGMEKDEAMFKMQHEEYEIKIMFYDCWRLFIDSEFESACLSGYWYFHDFQNIIKDLTGKELKLK